MQGSDVYRTLQRTGATHLHHVNTVTTSVTFLGQAGLVSRAYAQSNGLPQTPQDSDAIDRQFDVWQDIFLDTVDVHARAGRVRAPNVYGPVLFRFPLSVLLQLPSGTDVRVTRLNPIKWFSGQPDAERWFLTLTDLDTAQQDGTLRHGNFDQHVVLRVPGQKLPFMEGKADIVLDDPRQQTSTGADSFTHASARLSLAAATAGVAVSITKRVCNGNCVCLASYQQRTLVDKFFG